mmetsp:Transcript_4240/g.14917  ORF Transcript_4240/g.14917 Transcript_4240/m.14917 type:complete len:470 (-) Transcript_4240:2260-3669(-)
MSARALCNSRSLHLYKRHSSSIDMFRIASVRQQLGQANRPRRGNLPRPRKYHPRARFSEIAAPVSTGGDSLRSTMKLMFSQAGNVVFPGESSLDFEIAECSNRALGDYQCNSAMKIFAELKDRGDTRFKNPRSLAEAIIQAIPAENSFFEKLAVAGPGFINITFSREFLAQEALRVFHCSADGTFETTRKFRKLTAKRAVVDYSSPNIAKEMHVGHLRSTIIGETICRALEFVGVEVIRLNHVGDWGTQFGMLLAHLEDISESSDFEVKNLQELYKQSKIRFDSDEDFKKRARAAVVHLQAGDKHLKEKWTDICEVSRQDFEEIYRLLDVHILERGESYYNYLIPDVLSELIEKEIAVQSDGALCIFADGSDSPLICRKSNGSFNYASTDLAALWQRISDLCADWIIYVTDVGQKKHFDAIFDAASRAGWLKRENGNVSLDHVGFGLVMVYCVFLVKTPPRSYLTFIGG